MKLRPALLFAMSACASMGVLARSFDAPAGLPLPVAQKAPALVNAFDLRARAASAIASENAPVIAGPRGFVAPNRSNVVRLAKGAAARVTGMPGDDPAPGDAASRPLFRGLRHERK